MGAIRVMFIGQGPSGLAEDRIVNTFHFWNEEPRDPGDPLACANAVSNFYIAAAGASGTATATVASMLSPWVGRTAELRAYDMQEPGAGHTGEPPRTPHIYQILLGTAGSSEGLPEEVALVCTLHGAPPLGKRNRGRIYLGPLGRHVMTAAAASDASRPTPLVLNNLQIACQNLIAQTNTPLNWCIRSTLPTENYVPIVSGYIDNAFDTQRRRGPDPTARSTFSSLP